MDCRETRTLLNAFHDGELPAADRPRVEEHLRGCTECSGLLADLGRADRAAGVPDPGPAYWDRFNARVMDRVGREADDPGAKILRPKGGWFREQLRYLVPAAAAAALVLGVVYYGGMHPGAPTPNVPPPAGGPKARDSAGDRVAKGEPGSRVEKKTGAPTVERRPPPPAVTEERPPSMTPGGRDLRTDRSAPAGDVEASRERPSPPAPLALPSPPPTVPPRAAPAGSPPAAPADGVAARVEGERKKMAGTSDRMAEAQGVGKVESASTTAKEPSAGSPCGLARTLAERKRIREAEEAQRTCLAGDLDAPSRERNLVFLAELLDRQARFAEADAVIADVERQFPQSRPLEVYRRERAMVQKEPGAVPVTR